MAIKLNFSQIINVIHVIVWAITLYLIFIWSPVDTSIGITQKIFHEWKFILNHYDNTEELYNLKTDPKENNNLVTKENKIVQDLRKILKNHLEL